MARTIAQIQASMDAEQAAQTDLSGLNSTSSSAIYTLWKNIVATCQYYIEVLFDTKRDEIESILLNNVVGSELWIRTKAFEFQYDATTPQIIELINGVPTYPVIDETKQIITRCSVGTISASNVGIKVAKSEPPEPLTGAESSALTAYYNAGGNSTGGEVGLGMAGTDYIITSLQPDRLYIQAEIFYDGSYAGTISTDTIAALENYMASMPFDGYVKVLDVVDALQSVPGFVDIEVTELAVRAQTVAFASRTKLIDALALINKSLPTDAGYLTEEDTATYTFTDKLTFTTI